VAEIVYPDSDGEPMAENTRQWEWIVLLKENIDELVPDFVAGDHFWYPIEGHPEVRLAPDVMVCLGRPKGHRGSYMQFREEGVPPTVVIEVLSPGNSVREMTRKGAFYFRHGAREMIVVDPDDETGWAVVKRGEGEGAVLEDVPSLDDWTSPTLGIRFSRADGKLSVYRPDGAPFLSFEQVSSRLAEAHAKLGEASERAERESERAERESERAERESERAERESERAERESERAERESERARRLAARLVAMGIDPDSI
jgi:Uma2 family endonuclease